LYFEKPPLQYWLTAAAYAAFGAHEWTSRLPPALFGWLAVLAIGYAGVRIAGATSGFYAGVALAGTAWHIGNSHLVTLDAVLSGCLAFALSAFLVAQAAAATPAAQRRWMLAAWVAVAGAVLTKGPIGLLIPAGALLLHSLLARDWAVWRRLELRRGIAVLLVLCAPWFILVSSRNPEFARFFFIHENVERFLTTEHRRTGAWWYFVPFLLAGSLPWTGVLASAWGSTWGAGTRAANGFSWERFCWAWMAFVFLFFSLSGSKLPSYILPLFPAAALLVGTRLEHLPVRPWRLLLGALALGSVLLAAALWLGYGHLVPHLATERTPAEVYLAFGRMLKPGIGVIAAGAVAGWLIDRNATPRGRTFAVVAIALAMNLGLQLVFAGNDAFSATRSTAGLVTRLQNQSAPSYDARAPFYQVQLYDQTLPWYLRRTTTVVAYRDELALGLDAEPARGIASVQEWIRLWKTLPQGYALMDPGTYASLMQQGVPMRAAVRNGRYVLVARR
jgi:4-amino-4-deoxy-L-arabinose transferase-like glycosyltransferase